MRNKTDIFKDVTIKFVFHKILKLFLLLRSHNVLLKNVLGLVCQVNDQRFMRANSAQVQVLDIGEEATFHLIYLKGRKFKFRLNNRLNQFRKDSDFSVRTYSGKLLGTPDDFHEDSVDELPNVMETGAELDVRLVHLQLDQQQLRLNVLHLVKLLAKVIAVLQNNRRRKQSRRDKKKTGGGVPSGLTIL